MSLNTATVFSIFGHSRFSRLVTSFRISFCKVSVFSSRSNKISTRGSEELFSDKSVENNSTGSHRSPGPTMQKLWDPTIWFFFTQWERAEGCWRQKWHCIGVVFRENGNVFYDKFRLLDFLCRKPSISRTTARDFNIPMKWISCFWKFSHIDRRQVLSQDTRLLLDRVGHTNNPVPSHCIQRQTPKRHEELHVVSKFCKISNICQARYYQYQSNHQKASISMRCPNRCPDLGKDKLLKNIKSFCHILNILFLLDGKSRECFANQPLRSLSLWKMTSRESPNPLTISCLV